ncbi:MAG TPA: hydroxyethylthiazole kinase [Thermomicrobiales bacterium]|nr:hydroxyethylthiazole kinase [Thermomicrobiales bacterium]
MQTPTPSSTSRALREHQPLVQCITNYVSIDIAANVLNISDASSAVVHGAREAGEFANIASAVVVNIGTPSPPWGDGMLAAVAAAGERAGERAEGAGSLRWRLLDALSTLPPEACA